jgi:hypothetical protein
VIVGPGSPFWEVMTLRVANTLEDLCGDPLETVTETTYALPGARMSPAS